MAKLCPVSRKRKYPSKLSCMFANQDRPIIARSYFCRHCGMWHLTRKAATA